MTTVQEIENKGLAYKFIRGSHLYGTNVETSDVDFGGVYIVDNETLMGLPEYYEPQISDEKHDTTYYELGRWVELLMKANPNALESLSEALTYASAANNLSINILSSVIVRTSNGVTS